MKIDKRPKKSIIYYLVLSMVVVMVLNTFVFPLILQQQITQVDYGTFLSDVEKGKVSTVEIKKNEIGYTIHENGGG